MGQYLFYMLCNFNFQRTVLINSTSLSANVIKNPLHLDSLNHLKISPTFTDSLSSIFIYNTSFFPSLLIPNMI